MALDLWFRQDVERILSSIARTAGSVGVQEDGEYLRGFHDALLCVAEGFGLAESQISVERTASRLERRRESSTVLPTNPDL